MLPKRSRTRSLPLVSSLLISLAWTSAPAAPTITEVLVGPRPAQAKVGEPLLLAADGLASPVKVFLFNGTSTSLETTPVVADLARGIVAFHVPAGAQTGDMKVRANGVDSPGYYFRVEAGSFVQGSDAVSGRVRTAGGSPVSGALVALLRDKGGCGDFDFQDFDRTDPNGRYSMSGVDGSYAVFVLPPAGSGLSPSAAETALTSTPTTLDVTLPGGTSVTGKVVDATTSAAVARARIGMDYRGAGLSHEEALTDASGNFSVTLLAGDWEYTITPPPGDPHARIEGMVTISGGSQNLGNLGLAGGVLIGGTLTSATDGSPIAGAEVSAFVSSTCCTGADRKFSSGSGSYVLVVPQNQTYEVRADLESRAAFADASVQGVIVGTSNVTQNVVFQAAAFIAGTVTESGMGAPLGCLRLEARSAQGGFAGDGVTEGDGDYRIRVLPDPNGYLVASDGSDSGGPEYARQIYDGTPGGTYFECEGELVPAPMAGGTTSGIDFSLPQAVAFTGTISTEAAGCSDDLFPGGDLTVDDGTSHGCGLGMVNYSHPGPGYRYAMLPPSTVVPGLRACVRRNDYEPQCYDMKAPPAYDAIVLAPGGGTGGIDFCLPDCTPQIWYQDSDGDGFGNPDGSALVCGQPEGFVGDASDCDDMRGAAHPGAAETCNNLDDDCDQVPDNGNPGGGQACVTGLPGPCSPGTTECSSGAVECNQNVQPSPETCDDLDNNCNGAIDDGNPGGGSSCPTGLQGVCATGTMTCQMGVLNCVQDVPASAEACDNLDNDCDGSADGFATSCGEGTCASTGTCTAGMDDCSAGSPTAEVCDGADNNCDGSADEGNPGGGGGCATGLMGVCAAGTLSCQGGMLACLQNVASSAEVCDNLDNDCDGATDGFTTYCGVGECAAQGTCAAGVDSCAAGSPSAETCDMLDNDCNGAPDDPAGTDVDGDGVDGGCDLCPADYNPGQENSDGDIEGGDACDITVVFPLQGDVTCADPPPTIRWTPGTYNRFRVFLSWLPDFPGKKKVTSGDTLLKTTQWTVPARKWAKLCANANPTLYIKVFGKSTLTRTTEYTETASLDVE